MKSCWIVGNWNKYQSLNIYLSCILNEIATGECSKQVTGGIKFSVNAKGLS